MFRFPYFQYFYRYPSYYPPYYSKSNNTTYNDKTIDKNISYKTETENVQAKNRYTKKSTPIFPFSFNPNGFSDIEEPILEFLGIKLYQDDLIILTLLFILYKEEVKDETLFISLILLLLS